MKKAFACIAVIGIVMPIFSFAADTVSPADTLYARIMRAWQQQDADTIQGDMTQRMVQGRPVGAGNTFGASGPTWLFSPPALPVSNMMVAPNVYPYKYQPKVPFQPLLVYKYPEYSNLPNSWATTGRFFYSGYMPAPLPSGSPDFFYSWRIVKVNELSSGGFEYELALYSTVKPKVPAPVAPRRVWGLNLSNGRFEKMDAPAQPKPKPRTNLTEPLLTVPGNK